MEECEGLKGIELSKLLLEQKLQDHDNGFCKLSTQELIKIHEALQRNQPVGEFIMMTVVNEFEFLDGYQQEETVKKAIEKFLYAFKNYVRCELALNSRTNKDADKIL